MKSVFVAATLTFLATTVITTTTQAKENRETCACKALSTHAQKSLLSTENLNSTTTLISNHQKDVRAEK